MIILNPEATLFATYGIIQLTSTRKTLLPWKKKREGERQQNRVYPVDFATGKGTLSHYLKRKLPSTYT